MDRPDATVPDLDGGSVNGDTPDATGDSRRVSNVAPSVVAVVVTHQPGPWFEEALASLVAQDYPNLSLLVIDAGSAADPTPRIAAVAPNAFVRRLGRNPGYGAAANIALDMVEGAAFYMFCHDDVALAPNAVRLLVEEAYRSNAGVVGPKLVRWDRPEALLAVGMGADRFGASAPLCERNELDQEQHDGVRDVFFVPDACALVRADLFAALGGFDAAITFHGGDTDLCWRAHLAGARVIVAPSARAAHVEASGDRRRDDRRRLQLRHRLRMVLTNYGWFHTVAVGAQQLVLSVIEAVVALITGRWAQARDVAAAWGWNLGRSRSITAKRREVRRIRQVTDLEVRRLHVRGSARVTGFIRGQLGTGEGGPTSLSDAGRVWLSSLRAGVRRENVAVAVAVVAAVTFGSRHLLTGGVPAVGELVPFPDAASELVRAWWSGWRDAGLGSPGAAPTGLGLFGAAALVLGGATGLLRWLAVLAALPVGLLGAWRLGAVVPRSRAKAVALVAYAVNPLPYDALAAGSWRGLALYATAPWVILRLAAIGGLAPYGAPRERREPIGVPAPEPRRRRPWAAQVAGLGLLVAVPTVFEPGAPLLFAVVAAALAAGSLLAGTREGSGRLLVGGVAGCAVAAALHGPWLAGLVARGETGAWFASGGRDAAGESLWALFHFDIGVAPRTGFTWGLVVAALCSLAIARSWRLAWAVRGWTVVAAGLAPVAAVQLGVFDIGLPPPEVLLAPAAAGLALAVGAGMAAFDLDLPAYRFGWRQLVTVVGGAALVVASIPLVVGSFDGRWRMPRNGYDRTFEFLAADAATVGPFRVLWVGRPEALPVAGWSLDDGIAFAATSGYPSVPDLWPAPEGEGTEAVAGAVRRARSGDIGRLGRELSVMGVRYVVAVGQPAPAPYGTRLEPLPDWVVAALGGQLDLQQFESNPAVAVFRNTAWLPVVAEVPPEVGDAASLSPVTEAGPPPVPALATTGFQRAEGPVAAGEVVHLAQRSHPGWRLTVGDADVSRSTGFGWANRFEVDQSGPAELRYATSGWLRVALAGQAALWLVAIAVATGARRGGPGARPVPVAPVPVVTPAPPPRARELV